MDARAAKLPDIVALSPDLRFTVLSQEAMQRNFTMRLADSAKRLQNSSTADIATAIQKVDPP